MKVILWGIVLLFLGTMNSILLPHYNRLLSGKDTAFYLLCKKIPVSYAPSSPTNELWELHSKISENQKKHIKSCSGEYEASTDLSYLDLKVELSKRLLEDCEFCENRCKINRILRETGICGLSEVTRVSSAFLHHGEEPPLVPSGTIFFAGCSFGCVFCQNHDISSIGKERSTELGGTAVDGKKLALFADLLANQGARNINYVGGDPNPNIHTIIESLKYQTHNITQLWNSNFYNSTKSLELLVDIMDFWLPDFKYGNNECAKKYSKITKYWDVLTRNLKYIYDWDSRDIIIRHLVMPGHLDCCSKPILEWVAHELPGIPVNIMGQYHPDYQVFSSNYPEINRRVSHQEMIKVYSLAEKLNIPYKSVS